LNKLNINNQKYKIFLIIIKEKIQRKTQRHVIILFLIKLINIIMKNFNKICQFNQLLSKIYHQKHIKNDCLVKKSIKI
jgi:hypothetical protein